MSTFREFVEDGQMPFLPGTLDDFSAPGGQEVRWTLNLASWASTGTWTVLTALFGMIAAAGLYTLAGLSLTGLATFLLVRRLTGSAGAALVGGFAYAFYPFVVINAGGHVDFIHGWVLVLLLWRLIELAREPTTRNAVFGGLAFIFAASWTPYHVLFGGAMLAGVVVAALVAGRDRQRQVRGFAIASAMTAVWLGGMLLVATQASSTDEIRDHPIEAAYTYSARAIEYVVPADRHPLVGEEAGRWRAEHLHGSNASENNLYVGVVVLLLALAGFLLATRRRGDPRLVALAGGGIAVAAFAFSAPPKVNLLGVTLPTPSGGLWELTSTWRVFSRLVVVVELGLVVLAGLAVAMLLGRMRPALAVAVTGALLALVATDLRTAPPDGTHLIVPPPVYAKLAKAPPGIAVEYPLVPAAQSRYGDIFYQGWHDKPVLNGYPEGSPEERRAIGLADLRDPATARGLAALGVRWVMVRQDLEAAGLPDPGRPRGDYRFVANDGYLTLYELRTSGRPVLVSPWTGFYPSDPGPNGPIAWLRDPSGRLEVHGERCDPCAGTVRLHLQSMGGEPRTVTISAGGRVLARRRIVEGGVAVPVRFRRSTTLTITATPGPRKISEVLGTADARQVSVAVTRPRFVREGRR
jgi:hypothetical protein